MILVVKLMEPLLQLWALLIYNMWIIFWLYFITLYEMDVKKFLQEDLLVLDVLRPPAGLVAAAGCSHLAVDIP